MIRKYMYKHLTIHYITETRILKYIENFTTKIG